ncbi:MAG: VanZ family protein [Thermodesulfobacteriota bacterium]
MADSPMVDGVAVFNPLSLLHIPLYGILTLFLILSFSPPKKKVCNPTDPGESTNSTNPTGLWIAGIIALTVAVADEVHQAYLPTRNASTLDVFLDIIGIIVCVFLVLRFRNKSRFINFIVPIDGKTQKEVCD